jgi:RNase P subunit RPR2
MGKVAERRRQALHDRMKHLRCTKCGMEAASSWAFLWYQLEVEVTKAGKKRKRSAALCPDCAGQFRSDRVRKEWLRGELGFPAG